MTNGNDYPAVHKKPETTWSYKRLDMLWERYPQYHTKKPVPDINDLLQEHESWQEDFTDELREEYQTKQYDQFLVPLSWEDLPYRYETRALVESASSAQGTGNRLSGASINASPGNEAASFMQENPYVKTFMSQFTGFDADRKACFVFPESFSSQFMVMLEVCRRAEVFRPIQNLFPDEDRVHYIAVFDKRNMSDVLLMFHLVYGNLSEEMPGGYALYDYPFPWYQSHLRENGVVLRSPFLPDRTAKYQGSLPYCFNPAKTVYVRRNIEHVLKCGYMKSELEFFLSLTKTIMPFFQWWYTDLEMYESKDGIRTDWRLERTRIRTRLTAEGVIRPKWKHELSLFQAVRQLFPDTLYQYRPEWLGRQSLDLYIPSLQTAIEYQGIQHYLPIDFFGGDEALQQRQNLDQQKKDLCGQNGVKLIEWPYSIEPTEENVRKTLIPESESDQ